MGEFYQKKLAELREEKRRRGLSPEQIQLERSVEMIMHRMTHTTVGVPTNVQHRGIHRVDPIDFDGAEPWMLEDLFHADVNSAYFRDVKPSDLTTPMDVTIFKENTPDQDRWNFGDYQLFRFRQTTAKKLRGWVHRVSPVMVEVLTGWVDCDRNTVDTARAAFALAGPRRWVYAGPINRTSAAQDIDSESALIQVALGVAFSRDYQWRVYLGWEGLPGISFPTDPFGAQEVFRLRDLPEGAQRRSALRNWISEHWRKKRIDPQEEAKVRKHLRGATEFTWNGLYCRIMPSDYDQRLNVVNPTGVHSTAPTHADVAQR